MKQDNENIELLIKKSRDLAIAFFVLLLVALVAFFYIVYLLSNTTNQDSIYKDLLIIDNQIIQASDYVYDAEQNYNEASYSYEMNDWDGVVRYCEYARDDYSTYTQELRNIKATIKSDDELLVLRKQMIEKEIYRAENLFEACEHFESASRYYKIYFKEETPYDDPSFDMGDGEMDMMNEKIREHDKTVREYNDLLAEYTIELNRRLD